MNCVLRLDMTGMPRAWVTHKGAARLYAVHAVIWTLGAPFMRLHGGHSSISGTQSVLDLHPIIATRGRHAADYDKHPPRLSRRAIYARDRGLCMYCGERVSYWDSSMDHVIPRSHGGKTTFMNVVLAHRQCNLRKGARTPEEARMPLVATPFVPSKIEHLLIAAGHNVLQDQMSYLLAKAGNRMRHELIAKPEPA